jgi:hypothetical protein
MNILLQSQVHLDWESKPMKTFKMFNFTHGVITDWTWKIFVWNIRQNSFCSTSNWGNKFKLYKEVQCIVLSCSGFCQGLLKWWLFSNQIWANRPISIISWSVWWTWCPSNQLTTSLYKKFKSKTFYMWIPTAIEAKVRLLCFNMANKKIFNLELSINYYWDIIISVDNIYMIL